MARQDRAETPPKIEFPKDAREDKKSHDPKNSYIHTSRSGHVLEINDNEGAEHVTLQHRSGSMLQFMPDGTVTMTAHKGQYTVVFGENRMYVTGAYDVVVDGAASMKVKGDYNMTVDGNMNTTVTGDMNTVVGKNQNTTVVADQVIRAENQTTKISNNTEHTTEGKAYFAADGAMGLFSTSSSLSLGADSSVEMSSGTSTLVDAGTSMDIQSKSGMTLKDSSGIDLNP